MTIVVVLKFLNFLEYRWLNKKILKSRVWDLNICCGKQDGGGINADIKKYVDLPNFTQISDIYHLPFTDKQFENVLCAHTMEHVARPEDFYKELTRVGKNVTLVLPPVWDLGAVLDILEHKWIFLTWRVKFNHLPKYIKLPLADWWQKRFGQTLKA